MRAACPSHLKPRWLPSVDHSPRSDLSHSQVPENPEEDALQRPCSPKPGRRHGIKGSVLQQQISSLRGSHGLCCYFVSPCSFNPLSPQKGIFCVWPGPRALVNFLRHQLLIPLRVPTCRGEGTLTRLPPRAPHFACRATHLQMPSLWCRNELLPETGPVTWRTG